MKQLLYILLGASVIIIGSYMVYDHYKEEERKQIEIQQAIKRMEAESQAAVKELERVNREKLQAAVDAAKKLEDDFYRQQKARKELEAAEDRLREAKMRQELAGNEAARQAELYRLRTQGK